jgi:triphosphatase
MAQKAEIELKLEAQKSDIPTLAGALERSPENLRRPVKALPTKLRPGLDTQSAFKVIARGCLHQLVANMPALRAGQAEGLHQARVALRWLRAAISLFSKLLDDSHTRRIKAKLRWLTGELAPARDLDVYMKSKVEPLSGAVPAKQGDRNSQVSSSHGVTPP